MLAVLALAGCGHANTSAAQPVAITPVTLATLEAASADQTPTPLARELGQGQAAAVAAATDAALQPTPRTPLTFDQNPVPITFDEFYDGFDLRKGLQLSDKLVSLDGKDVLIDGYMAPPLKPELDYFVLTRIRLQVCPFCSTAAEWPDDIALVYVQNGPITTTERPLRLIGRMEVGASVDQETGMVSLVRIYAQDVEVLQ
jgi:hypothetical protein